MFLSFNFQNTAVVLAIDSYWAYSSVGDCTNCKLRIRRRQDGEQPRDQHLLPVPSWVSLLGQVSEPSFEEYGFAFVKVQEENSIYFLHSDKGNVLRQGF